MVAAESTETDFLCAGFNWHYVVPKFAPHHLIFANLAPSFLTNLEVTAEIQLPTAPINTLNT